MRFFILSFSLIIFSQLAVTASPGDTARVEIDIRTIRQDRAKVLVYPARTNRDTLIYNMPRVVPGTYSVSDFGRFLNDFSAVDSSGKQLEVERLDTNRWAVANAGMLDHISYWVDDTFDGPPNGIFEPGGTQIDSAQSIMLNNFGFVGYFEGMKDVPYTLTVTRPKAFFGETSLDRVASSDTSDLFAASDYFELHDCPILYCEPDTASMHIGDTRIGVSVYSPTGQINAPQVLDSLRGLFLATADYLGGTLPVDRYSILLYLTAGGTMSGSMGALEHNTSTTFVLPDAPIAALSQTIRDVTAHEFMHVVTPLSIHSEQIGNFDFMDPEMSRHLWFYEGSTEYASHHIQVKEGLISMEDFLQVIHNKIVSASQFDTTIAFTEMSRHILDKYSDQFGNVYQKGTLICMVLDLKLRKWSEGTYGIQNLKRDLSKHYGPDSSFVDTTFFNEIGRISGYPEIIPFLETHVAGTTPLPLREVLDYAGIMYRDSLTEPTIDAGNMTLGYNPRTEKMVIVKIDTADAFNADLKAEARDELVSWNGTPVDLDNVKDVIDEFKETIGPGDKVKIVVNRKNKKGEMKSKTLKARAVTTVKTRYNVLEPQENPTPEQLKIREVWINK